jgi:pimeloyl-ACP methyl ester carboxylesterase
VALGAGGCRAPNAKIDRFAAERAFERETVAGTDFHHVVMRNSFLLAGSVLHAYIEGDGMPFVNSATVAADPTPLHPLMLHLMALDLRRAVYVGRPCYFGLRIDRACNPSYWSTRRFSPEVVASMAAVIREEMQRAGASSVQLFGHSGGGALVVLLTRQLSVNALVTIGGNLDTDAWANVHGYTPLIGSLNPADVVLDPVLAVRATHFVGSEDTVVPASLVHRAAERIGGTVREIPGFSHQCCWERMWPSVLAEMARE